MSHTQTHHPIPNSLYESLLLLPILLGISGLLGVGAITSYLVYGSFTKTQYYALLFGLIIDVIFSLTAIWSLLTPKNKFLKWLYHSKYDNPLLTVLISRYSILWYVIGCLIYVILVVSFY